MKRGTGITIAGAAMIVLGHFLSQLVLNLIPTINPAHSSLIADTNYHMLAISNQLALVSQIGIIVLVIGIFVFFIDRRSLSKKN